jgi:hypothetical protein
MEDEDPYFYESEKDFFGENSHQGPVDHLLEPFGWLDKRSSSEKEDEKEEADGAGKGTFRAYNPMDRLKTLPEGRHNDFMFLMNNNKTFNGIQHFFNFGEEDQHRGEFLENIESDAFGDNCSDFELDKLFQGEAPESQRALIQHTLSSLQTRVEVAQQKMLGSVNLSRAISPSFYEHFENFTLVLESSSFIKEFEQNFRNMAAQCKRLKGPGIDLFASLYEFWTRSFKDLINEIWRYSSKFTLNFFKKNEPQDADSIQHPSDFRSESSNTNTMGSKDKR